MGWRRLAPLAELDRPAWFSLAGRHAHLALGGPLARRYRPDVNVFAAVRDDTPAAHAALADLIRAGEHIYLVQVLPVVIAPGFALLRSAQGVQMLAARGSFQPEDSAEFVALGDGDAPEMLALATLTEPGPFLPRTHTMGEFLGIRIDGRLAAMAGERMRLPGYTELSGVCTHPDFRGRGLARRLSVEVSRRIVARGERPFLHAWKSNIPAIRLYQSMGFELRAEVNVAVLERERMT